MYVQVPTGLARSLLIDFCHELHIQPNLKCGKTEIMLCFRGSGSKALRRQYYSQQDGFPVVCEHASYKVSVVRPYLHLGGLIDHRVVTNAPEVTKHAVDIVCAGPIRSSIPEAGLRAWSPHAGTGSAQGTAHAASSTWHIHWS